MSPFQCRGRTKIKELDQEWARRRIHKVVPWIQNPLHGAGGDNLHFAPRREASTIELFFDLFFVANLATFTAYHSINDHSSFLSYVGFFAIIWATWFHVTLHDVRFAQDTVYERAAKTVQMVCFVGFALVGSSFAPGTADGKNTNFRILCYILLISRTLFVIQYCVIGFFVAKARRTDLFLPLFLNVLTYALAAAVFTAMTPAFREGRVVETKNRIYSLWWIVMSLESIATIAISCVWRMLSFKKTHLVERMGLLTLIVIGEGAIGVTKTISRMMGKHGLDPEGSALVLCIILLLVGIWTIYFDNHPHGHYGTIRQQIWSALHFPLHLAIVGVVEGAQQIALARYVLHNLVWLEEKLVNYCLIVGLDGSELVFALNSTMGYFQLDQKAEGAAFNGAINATLTAIASQPGICTSALGTSGADLPSLLITLFSQAASAFYSSLGVRVPANRDPLRVAYASWRIIYLYFWGALLLLFICFMVCSHLVRRNKLDAFDVLCQVGRGLAVLICTAFLALAAREDVMYAVLRTPVILPLAVGLVFVIVLVDRIGAWIANRRNRNEVEDVASPARGKTYEYSSHGSSVGSLQWRDHGSFAVMPMPYGHPGSEWDPGTRSEVPDQRLW